MFDMRTSQSQNLKIGAHPSRRGMGERKMVSHTEVSLTAVPEPHSDRRTNLFVLRITREHIHESWLQMDDSLYPCKCLSPPRFIVCCWKQFHPHISKLGLSVPLESLTLCRLRALRQSCTEWWLSGHRGAPPAAGPPWWVDSHVSEAERGRRCLDRAVKQDFTKLNRFLILLF